MDQSLMEQPATAAHPSIVIKANGGNDGRNKNIKLTELA